MASAQLAKVLDIIKSQPRNPNATVGHMRGGMEKVAERVPPDVACEAVRVGDMAAEWITPPGAATDRAILYLHGGGYVMGSINTHRAMVARIARAAQGARSSNRLPPGSGASLPRRSRRCGCGISLDAFAGVQARQVDYRRRFRRRRPGARGVNCAARFGHPAARGGRGDIAMDRHGRNRRLGDVASRERSYSAKGRAASDG